MENNVISIRNRKDLGTLERPIVEEDLNNLWFKGVDWTYPLGSFIDSQSVRYAKDKNLQLMVDICVLVDGMKKNKKITIDNNCSILLDSISYLLLKSYRKHELDLEDLEIMHENWIRRNGKFD